MICDACGATTFTLKFKTIEGTRKGVCDDCFKWKGVAPPTSVESPVKKNLI